MLGHQLFRSWRSRHVVAVTLRRPFAEYASFGLFDPTSAYDRVDVRDLNRVAAVLDEFRPEAVVNAAGIIKHRDEGQQRLPSLEINAVFPHRLRELCVAVGSRLVHISTDCVFSGRRGDSTEHDPPDAQDVYGLSKYLGEVTAAPAVTLRTSIIGLELARKTGLVEWFLAQRGPIRGFTRAIYTGLTTVEMNRVIEHVLIDHPDLAGMWQVASAPITKYDLLARLAGHLGRRDVEVRPDPEFVCDRSLNGDAFTLRTGYRAPSWDAMLAELAHQIRQRGISHAAA